MILHVGNDPAIPPQSLENEGGVVKTLTYAAVALAVIAGAVPAMAQFVQPVTPNAAITVQAQPQLNAEELARIESGGAPAMGAARAGGEPGGALPPGTSTAPAAIGSPKQP